MLHIDIPTLAEFKALAAIKSDTCVSLYVPTSPSAERARQNRIALEDLAALALSQLKEGGTDKRAIAPIEEHLRHLAGADKDDTDDDKIRKLQNKKPDPIDAFWKFQGHGLAVLATPKMMRTFRLPYRPKPLAEAADRFHLAPLVRAMTSPQDIFVLALAEKGVRLVRAFVNLPPARIHVPELPKSGEEAAHRAGLTQVSRVARAPIASFKTGPCLRFPQQAQFHPLKYLYGLAKAIEGRGGRIFTGTHAEKIEAGPPGRVTTTRGPVVTATSIVVATNTPVNDIVRVHTKQAAYRSYVIGAQVPKGSVTPALYWDTADPFHYVRLQGIGKHEVIIVGGEDHKTGQADDTDVL